MTEAIRVFNRDDTQGVIKLWEDCGLLRPWNDPTKDIQRKLALDDDLFLVMEKDDSVIGSVMAGYDGHRGWINYLAIHPDLHRRGYGRQLMQAAEERLLHLGCPKINLQIRRDNIEMAAFYASLGFCEDQCISLGKRIIKDD